MRIETRREWEKQRRAMCRNADLSQALTQPSKAELRQMLAQAARNTAPPSDRDEAES